MIRAKRITDKARIYYDSAVYNCACISKTNHSLCFIVKRIGPFGSPEITAVPRPDVVLISETNNFVVAKDGIVYELTQTKYGQKN